MPSGWTGSGANEGAKGQFSHRATGPNTTSTIAVKYYFNTATEQINSGGTNGFIHCGAWQRGHGNLVNKCVGLCIWSASKHLIFCIRKLYQHTF